MNLLEEVEILVDDHRQYDRVIQVHRLLDFRIRVDVLDDARVEPIVGKIAADPACQIVIGADNRIAGTVVLVQ